MANINEKRLKYLEFVNRENNFRHLRYEEEIRPYLYMKAGDPRALDAYRQLIDSPLVGHLSDDPLRNRKYLFVSAVTLTTRYAIEGGMDPETAYNISDLFIQEMDTCQSTDAVRTLELEMVKVFITQLAKSKKETVYSRPVVQCIDYIYNHLNETISLQELAKETGLHPGYLSTLFHREMGMTLTEYIRKQRIETAKNMLLDSEYSYAEIAALLAFSSQSHFTRVFREETGYTPKAYQTHFFRTGIGQQH